MASRPAQWSGATSGVFYLQRFAKRGAHVVLHVLTTSVGSESDLQRIDMNQATKSYEKKDFEFPYDPFRPALGQTSRMTLAYLGEREWDDEEVDTRVTIALAIARLQWVLLQGRAQLCGLFDEDDVRALMTCFQNQLFSPEEIRRLPTSLCDEYGIDLDRYKQSRLGPLVDKILGLDRPSLVALADALEHAWRGVGKEKAVGAEAFEALGIELLDSEDESETA